MNYPDLVRSYFFQPQHVGRLDFNKDNMVTCFISDALKINYFALYLSYDQTGLIIKARFKACGSPYLVAGLEWLCRQFEGSLIKDHPKFNYLILVEQLTIPNQSHPVAILVEKGYNHIISAMQKKFSEEKNE